MKKYLATTACTVALSLFGVLGTNSYAIANAQTLNSNINTTRVEQCVSKTLANKNINLSKCKSVKELVKILKKNGCKNITTKNIKNVKALNNILKVINNKKCNVKATPAPTVKPQPTTAPTPTTKPQVTTTPTTTTKPEVTSSNSSYANQVLQLVNQERAKAGLNALTTNSAITAAANKRAQEIKQSFSHTRPNGTSPFTALQEYNVSYRAAGENIAYGQKTPQEVVTGWMNSPGHRANILNANFGKIGIGVYQSNGVYYWTQLFTN